MSHPSCLACTHTELSRVYDFGLVAPSRRFLTPELAAEPEPVEPLILYRCARCGLLQLAPHKGIEVECDSPATATDPHAWAESLRREWRGEDALEWDIPDVLAFHDQLNCDLIRHETRAYWTVGQLQRLLQEHGLTLENIRPAPNEPGMLRVSITREGRPPRPAVAAAIERETEADLESPRAWDDFALLLDQSRDLLNSELDEWQYRNKRLAAYTVSGRGMTTLSLCDACRRFPCLIDECPDMRGLLTPGHRIPIVGPERLKTERFDVLLLLVPDWDAEGYGIVQEYWRSGGRLLIPAPKPYYADPPHLDDTVSSKRETAVFADFG
ncbi:MAG: methyltransferase C-terminal domain-containing protein [Gemmataceae bacterium]|nr:methyltransferase C-terminal domain-containing protein [Gemmataceae bacterium]